MDSVAKYYIYFWSIITDISSNSLSFFFLSQNNRLIKGRHVTGVKPGTHTNVT